MLEIKLKTWSCACGYKQDCEPSQENQDKHFNLEKRFALDNVSPDECPSCALRGIRGMVMAQETDPAKKVTILINDSQADLDQKRAELESEPAKQVKIGESIRSETPVELAARLDFDTDGSKEPMTKVLPDTRDEDSKEKADRIDKEMAALSIASPEEIDRLRLLEDK